MRVALVAGLMFGLVAMHSLGHSSHAEQDGQITVTAHSAHHGHPMDDEPPPAEDDSGPSSLLSAFGLMVCGAVIARFAFQCVRSATWSRLVCLLASIRERIGRVSAQGWLPPPLAQPTGVQVNRIAVLRI